MCAMGRLMKRLSWGNVKRARLGAKIELKEEVKGECGGERVRRENKEGWGGRGRKKRRESEEKGCMKREGERRGKEQK
jgi:hypothetical protein